MFTNMANYNTAGSKYITFKGNRFHIKENGEDRVFTSPSGEPSFKMDWVIVNSAPDLHCLWYKNRYNPNLDVVKPDAVWWSKGPAPADVPPHVLTQKVDVEGQLRKQYIMKQRLAVALLLENPGGGFRLDLENHYVTDISAMSVFYKDEPDRNVYSFSGLMRMCHKLQVYPCAFPVRVTFGTDQSVPYLRFTPFLNHEQTALAILPEDTIMGVIAKASSREVIEALNPVTQRWENAVEIQAPPQPDEPLQPYERQRAQGPGYVANQVPPYQPPAQAPAYQPPAQAPAYQHIAAPVQEPAQAPAAKRRGRKTAAPAETAPEQAPEQAPAPAAPVSTPQEAIDKARETAEKYRSMTGAAGAQAPSLDIQAPGDMGDGDASETKIHIEQLKSMVNGLKN
jgi:hypothetical protein